MSTEQFWQGAETSEQVKQKNKRWFKAMPWFQKYLYVLMLLILLVCGLFVGFNSAVALSISNIEKSGEHTVSSTWFLEDANYVPVELEGIRTVLIVGCDTREEGDGARSDTIMVAFFNINEKSVNLLSIPRDSYVTIPGHYNTKINHAFFYGGISLTMQTVEYLLGITIDDYVVIDFDGFKDVIDALGGVVMDVDMDMYNEWENIDLKAGPGQLLNGYDALAYARYRGADCSDYQRIQHQQQLVSAMADKLLSFSTLTNIANIINTVLDNIDTTISFLSAMDLASYALKMDFAHMDIYTVAGRSKYIMTSGYWISYEIIDKAALQNTLNAIAGDGFEFNPNVIDDNGMGFYSIPDDSAAETTTDDDSIYPPPDTVDNPDNQEPNGSVDTSDTVDTNETGTQDDDLL